MRAKMNPNVKDFKKLNKVVLAEGATNSMVGGILVCLNLFWPGRYIFIGE